MLTTWHRTTWSKVRTWTFLCVDNMTQDLMVQSQDLEDLDLPLCWQHDTGPYGPESGPGGPGPSFVLTTWHRTTWSKVRTWRTWTFLCVDNMTQDHMVQSQDLEDLDLPWSWQHDTGPHDPESGPGPSLDLTTWHRTTWSRIRTWRTWTFLGLDNMTQDHMIQNQDLEDLDLPWTWQHDTGPHDPESGPGGPGPSLVLHGSTSSEAWQLRECDDNVTQNKPVYWLQKWMWTYFTYRCSDVRITELNVDVFHVQMLWH